MNWQRHEQVHRDFVLNFITLLAQCIVELTLAPNTVGYSCIFVMNLQKLVSVAFSLFCVPSLY